MMGAGGTPADGVRVMLTLSYVTIGWSTIAAGALLLAVAHSVRWAFDRGARADLAFAIVALCFVGVAFTELGGMQSRSAAEWGLWLRWCHLPLFGMTVGTAVFIHLYLDAGRRWLLLSYIGARSVILIANFATWPNFNFASIDSIERIRFLGETVTVVGQAVPGRWQALGTLSTALLIVYVLDASITGLRRPSSDERLKAAVIGGSVCLFLLTAATFTQLVIWRVLQLPFLITPAFFVPMLIMASELGKDMLRASRLEREMRANQRRLELAAGSAKLGLWEWDGRRQRVWATRQARDLFGLTEADSADFPRWLEKVDHEDAHRLVHAIGQSIESGEEYSTEFRVHPTAETTRLVQAHGRAEQASPDRTTLVRGVLWDITEQRRAADETLELRRELALAGRVSMLGQLSSSLAHELSQPLGAILRNAEAAGMLLDAKSPDIEELKAIVTDIQRDDRRARDVIERVRAMLRRREADVQPVTVKSLIEDVIDLLRADAATREITLEHAASADLPTIMGDRVQLSQVLLNLVLNAMDAVEERPSAGRLVRLAASAAGDGGVEISVTDSGLGVPIEFARQIFEPFFTTKSTGMGMGLAISRAIVEHHGGTLAVSNNTGPGATFRLRLPVREEMAA
jgi:two-component system sensor kinase FixL